MAVTVLYVAVDQTEQPLSPLPTAMVCAKTWQMIRKIATPICFPQNEVLQQWFVREKKKSRNCEEEIDRNHRTKEQINLALNLQHLKSPVQC